MPKSTKSAGISSCRRFSTGKTSPICGKMTTRVHDSITSDPTGSDSKVDQHLLEALDRASESSYSSVVAQQRYTSTAQKLRDAFENRMDS